MDYDSDGEPILSAEQQQQAKQAARRHEAHGGGLCLNRPPSTPKASSLSPPQLSASQLSPSALQKGEKAMRYAMRMEEQARQQLSACERPEVTLSPAAAAAAVGVSHATKGGGRWEFPRPPPAPIPHWHFGDAQPAPKDYRCRKRDRASFSPDEHELRGTALQQDMALCNLSREMERHRAALTRPLPELAPPPSPPPDATHKRQGVRLSIQNKIWRYHFLY